MVKADGEALPGAGDFIMRSSQIKTMQLGWVVGFPASFVVLLLIAAFIKYGRRSWNFAGEQSKFRWVSQFTLLTTGLSASQLYRIIDQILIEQAIQYDKSQGKEGVLSCKNDPAWDRQSSTLAYISTDHISAPLPVTEVQIHVNEPANAKTTPHYRLTLGLSSEAGRKPTAGDFGPRFP